jgi:hypothetical protein
MIAMRNFKTLSGILALTAAVAASASCGDVARLGRAPVFLVINSLQARAGGDAGPLSGTLQSDVITNVMTPPPCAPATPCPTIINDVGAVTLRTVPKDIGTTTAPTTPSTNNEVTINRYRVVYRRADGRNTPGLDVPYAFDGAVTGTVPATGTITLGFEIVRHVAKMESPLVQLTVSPTIISTIADVSFYGSDRVGNDISVTGSILIDFGNFGDH